MIIYVVSIKISYKDRYGNELISHLNHAFTRMADAERWEDEQKHRGNTDGNNLLKESLKCFYEYGDKFVSIEDITITQMDLD